MRNFRKSMSLYGIIGGRNVEYSCPQAEENVNNSCCFINKTAQEETFQAAPRQTLTFTSMFYKQKTRKSLVKTWVKHS